MGKVFWSSRSLFILAAVGSAVGIGNIWRFPYVFATNGGAAFLIPYLLFVFLFGLPLMLLETAAGARLRQGFPSAIGKLRVPSWVGWLPLVFGVVILSYYMVITGWTLFHSLSLLMDGQSSFAASSTPVASVLFGWAVLTFAAWVALRGIEGGIEKVLRWSAPVFVVGLLALLAYSLSLPATQSALGRLLVVDFSGLASAKTWLFAASQAIFSLSVGYVILYTYGAYLKDTKNLGQSMFFVAIGDTAVALVAVAVALPVALASGAASGFSVSFDSALALFVSMPHGALFGAGFFGLLFIAAFTSVISMLEAPVLAIKDAFGLTRRQAVDRAGLVLLPLVILSGLSYSGVNVWGLPVIEFLDLLFGSLLAPFSALVVAVLVAWKLDPVQLFQAAGVNLPFKGVVNFWMRFAVPAVLLALSVAAVLHVA
ncbi:sodium-dependent transporter [Candidatus Micrarchaeota archaeon]|nr:sodium-dependent transporter [Candidatus Micrarchaeota archaeon]